MERYYRTSMEDDLDFEKGRIRALRDERLHIQKKTFTKWVNSFLNKNKIEVRDLFIDLSDGKYLMRLLEIISGEKLGKPNAGKMRVHKIENVNKCLAFLHTKVRLESIGAEDIVDGNPRLILGLIWTIILRFQIQEIEINVDEQQEDSGKKSAKDALLLWCQRNTRGYRNVDIRDFTSSWRDGLAFNALLHNQRPDAVNFEQLHHSNHTQNLELAFSTAEQKFGISRLLDPEDVDVARPDEKSILTYVASYYHTFSKLNEGFRGGKKITNIISKIKRIEEQQHEYEIDSKALLEWIVLKMDIMKKKAFSNSLSGVQNDVRLFKSYMTKEKPPKCKDKVNIEANFFEIEMKLKELRQSPFVPPEGQRLSDIDQAWKALENQEHMLETALRAEVIRQEKLEQLVTKLLHKISLRNSYLSEMIQVLSDPRYGSDLSSVEASLKRHQAISADILSREDRFNEIVTMVQHIVDENYHDKEAIEAKGKQVCDQWAHLLDLLQSHQAWLERDNDMLIYLRDLDTVHSSVATLQQSFNSDDFQKAANLESSMQKLNLYELEVNTIADAIKRLKGQGKPFLESVPVEHRSPDKLKAASSSARWTNELARSVSEHLQALQTDYDRLMACAKATRQTFEDFECMQQMKNDLDEVSHWVSENVALLCTKIIVKDLLSLNVQQERHKTFENAKKHWANKYANVQKSMQRLGSVVPDKGKIPMIDEQWQELRRLSADREAHLAALFAKLNLNTDLNEAESWMKDVNSLVTSKDHGHDEVTANALLNRHREVNQQIKLFHKDMVKLDSGLSKLKLQAPTTVYQKKYVEQRSVPQVRALYNYNKHGISVVKGELMFLIQKSNQDWWNVRTASGQDGFAPATYLAEVEPKVVQVEVVMNVEHFDTGLEDLSTEALHSRIDSLKVAYKNIETKAAQREALLMNAIQFFNFKAQCDRCKFWLGERQRDLLSIKGSKSSSLQMDEVCKSILKYETKIVELRQQADQLSSNVPSQKEQICLALQEVEKLWTSLDAARKTSERKISTKLQLEGFMKTCTDAIDWISEKLLYVDSLDSMLSVTALDSMIRRHNALQREMVPINEKVLDVKSSYKVVTRTFPDEVKSVAPKVNQMVDLHNQLTKKLDEKSAQIKALTDESHFLKLAQDYLDWLSSRQSQIEQTFLKDLAKAHLARALIEEIEEELPRKEEDFREIGRIASTMRLIPDSSNATLFSNVQQARHQLTTLLLHQKQLVDQATAFKQFNQEADAIESHIASCRRLLPNFDGHCLNDDELDVMNKKQIMLASLIQSHDKRVSNFASGADKLKAELHVRYEECVHRRDAIIRNWAALNEDFNSCSQKLQENKTFLELMSTIDNMQHFIDEKAKVAQDKHFRDPNHLRTKLKKHEALDGEVKANGSEMRLIKMKVDKLCEEQHPEKAVIEDKYAKLLSSWTCLAQQIKDQYTFLKESLNGVEITSGVEVINSKAVTLTSELQTPLEIHDVKHCNQLIAKHKSLHNHFKTLEQKFVSLESDAQEIQKSGLQKQQAIKGSLDQTRVNLEKLKPLFEDRLFFLTDSLKFHQLMSELNAELQWIQEKEKLMSSSDALTSSAGLMQVRSLAKRHKSLEEEVSNHLPALQTLIEKARLCQDQNDEDGRAKKTAVDTICKQLQDGVAKLKSRLSSRALELETQIKMHTLLEEINEIENWIQVKRAPLESDVTGKDEDTILMYLTKQKAFELELDSYAAIISEMKKNSQQLCQSGSNMADVVRHKDDLLTQELSSLQKLSRSRRNALMSQLQLLEFLRECEELKKWIKDKMVAASSQDLGQDYEHLELLITKYETLRKDVLLSGKEKLDNVLTLSQRVKPDSADLERQVRQSRDECQHALEALLSTVETRGKKLDAAGEIHKFNRDVAEALLRIQEKRSSLDNEYGKDIKSIQRLLRLHDAFEKDLVVLEGQLQALSADSKALQAKYPGPNAEHIKEQLNSVDLSWSDLKDRSKKHRDMLKANCTFQTFLLHCQDLLSWCSHLKIMLLSEEKVSSVAEAQLLKQEHENVKLDIEGKEEQFEDLIRLSSQISLSAFQHDVAEKKGQVLKERENLHMAWTQKKVYLDQLLDLHFFIRDTKQINAFYTSQDRLIHRTTLNLDDMEAVQKELKYFDTNRAIMKTFDDRVLTLQDLSKKLIDQNHFNSPFIRSQVHEIVEYQRKVIDEYRLREVYLQSIDTALQFHRDVTEVQSWMQDKMANFSKAAKEYEQGSLADKIRFLQKYTVFQNEVSKHEVVIKDIAHKGNILIKSNYKVKDTEAKLNSLLRLWDELRALSDQIGKDLQDALDMYNLQSEIEAIDAVVWEKEHMANMLDIGRDLEHCKHLHNKLSEANVDASVSAKVDKARKLSAKVSTTDEGAKAMARLEAVLVKWHSIQDSIHNYRQLLQQAMLAHQLISDMNEVTDIVMEKRNLPVFDERAAAVGAEKAYQKGVTVQDYVKSLEGKIRTLEASAIQLIRQPHPLHKELQEALSVMLEAWQRCMQHSEEQLEAMARAISRLKSMKLIADRKDAVASLILEMESIDYPETDVEAIEAALAKHEDRKAALYIQHEMQHDQDAVVEERSQLMEQMSKAQSTWEACRSKLLQCRSYYAFNLKLIDVNSWIENKKAFIEVEAVGESFAENDDLLRKHQEFDRSLAQQSKSMGQLQAEADQLVQRNHFRQAAITRSMKDVRKRLNHLADKNSLRIEELQAARKCFALLRKINEMRSWMKEKLHVALDESYLELTNIHAKLQRHSVFQSEIASNHERFDSILREGEATTSGPAVPDSIKKEVLQQLDDLKAEWQHLHETMKTKRIRLEQAHKAVDFINTLDEIEAWMTGDAADVLTGQDHGKDASSARALLKKHGILEAELFQQEPKVSALKEACSAFERDNHFAYLTLQKKLHHTIRRLEELQQHSESLKEALHESLVYHELYNDAHDALLWEQEKMALMSSHDFGNSLAEVQSMMKRHQLLEADIANHQNIVNAVVSKGEHMVKTGHQKREDIEAVLKQLLEHRDQLRDAAAIRKLRLDDSLESHQFFIQCHEVMSWINEKDLLLVSQKSHNRLDHDLMQSMEKRIDELQLELANHTEQVQVIEQHAESLVQRGHFERDKIAKLSRDMSDAFVALQNKIAKHRLQLSAEQHLARYFREKDEMVDLINSQLTVASSEDYGKDLHDVQRLIHNFQLFMDNLGQHEEKLSHFKAMAAHFIGTHGAAHLHQGLDLDLEKQTNDVLIMWDDLIELANARKEALAGAKKVHAFDKRIDDTLEWILEKEALMSVEISSPDSESIQDLEHCQVGLKQDVKAIREQIVSISAEADSLTSCYPDAVDHIVAKRRELLRAIENLDKKVGERDQQIEQTQQLIDYATMFRELNSWCSGFMARMSSPELSKSLPEAVTVHSRHKLMHDEMKARFDTDFLAFFETGQAMESSGHLMADDIRDKMQKLSVRKDAAVEFWQVRNRIYEQHLDYLRWLQTIHEMETWMEQKEDDLHDPDYGQSMDEVDKLLMRQMHMEEALQNKAAKMSEIQRLTLIETEFQELKRREEEAKRADELRIQTEKIEAVKKREQVRKFREKRREDERRRTQEIILPSDHNFKEPVTGMSSDKEAIKKMSPSSVLTMASSTLATGIATSAPPSSSSMSYSIPRFNTRRSQRQATRSKSDVASMPPIAIEDYLERKQDLQSGGRRSTIRSWKTYYTVLSDQILCFFKDVNDFKENKASAAPLLIHRAQVMKASDYTKKKHVFRLITQDQSEFLFDAGSPEKCQLWTDKISAQASLETSSPPPLSSLPLPPHQSSSDQAASVHTDNGQLVEDEEESSPNHQEPLYANLPSSGSYDAESNELDAREKRGMLKKFLAGRKHKSMTLPS